MEKFIFAMFILLAIGGYWWEYLTSFNKISDDAAIGKAMIGFVLTACAGLLLFNLDMIL